ncbi:MAG: hypothetical protein ACREOO_17220 [bacterium]
MPFINDFANAVSNYPANNVNLSIVDVTDEVPKPGEDPNIVNVNEVFTFRVRIRNNGHLNMTGISLHINGNNGAKVSKSSTGPFSDEIVFGNLVVNGHGGQQDTEKLFFKAPANQKPAGTELIEAHLNSWNANLAHILDGHSAHTTTPSAAFSTKVHPI